MTGDSDKSDYCGWVADTYEAIMTSPHFRRFLNELYDPLRLNAVVLEDKS